MFKVIFLILPFILIYTPQLWVRYIFDKYDKEIDDMPFNGYQFGNKILSEKNGWLQIKSLIDSYIGWINDKQVKEISKVNAEKITFDHKIFSTRIIDYIETDENKLSSIVLGSNIGACKYLGHKYDGPKNKKTKTK